MSELIEYKCPCCSGKLEFDSGTQKMKCPFCDSEFDVETVQQYNDELNENSQDSMNWESQAGSEWQGNELEGMKVYTCQSCGGEVIAEETTGATHCPYCDNPIVMTGSFSGDLRPDFVIPFKLDKEKAKASLMKHLDGKVLLPKIFRSQNHIDEIKGIYVPVWLFNSDVDADIHYKAEIHRRWSDNNYRYTEKSYFSVKRSGKIAFELIPVDGSEKMPDDLMESIEPFDFKDAVDFKTAYLSGYLADKYDVTAEQSVERANKRIKESTEDAFRSTVRGYDAVHRQNGNIRLYNSKFKYALYPVWILNTSWNGKKFTFAMNGQTGKFVGNLPADNVKATACFLGATAVATAIAYLIVPFFM